MQASVRPAGRATTPEFTPAALARALTAAASSPSPPVRSSATARPPATLLTYFADRTATGAARAAAARTAATRAVATATNVATTLASALPPLTHRSAAAATSHPAPTLYATALASGAAIAAPFPTLGHMRCLPRTHLLPPASRPLPIISGPRVDQLRLRFVVLW